MKKAKEVTIKILTI